MLGRAQQPTPGFTLSACGGTILLVFLREPLGWRFPVWQVGRELFWPAALPTLLSHLWGSSFLASVVSSHTCTESKGDPLPSEPSLVLCSFLACPPCDPEPCDLPWLSPGSSIQEGLICAWPRPVERVDMLPCLHHTPRHLQEQWEGASCLAPVTGWSPPSYTLEFTDFIQRWGVCTEPT